MVDIQVIVESIKSVIQSKKDFKAVVLPDFYLDVIVHVKDSIEELLHSIETIYSRGGGNLLGSSVEFVAGGNGGNVARVLNTLGVPTTFITKTDSLGQKIIDYYLKSSGIKVISSLGGSMASSVILEIPKTITAKEVETSNVMISSAGSVSDFSSQSLNEEQWKIILHSDVVAITNAQNLVMEELVETILSKTAKKNIFVSVDFSDLTPHRHRINDFRQRILNHPTHPPSLIVGNENEIVELAKINKKSPEEAIKKLSSTFEETIFAFHTAKKAEVWKAGEQLANEPCYEVSVSRATGAGDTWHAGFVTGFKTTSDVICATRFANAIAGFKVSQGEIEKINDLIDWVKKTPLQSIKS